MSPFSLLCFRLNKLQLSQPILDLTRKVLNFLMLYYRQLQTSCHKDQELRSQVEFHSRVPTRQPTHL